MKFEIGQRFSEKGTKNFDTVEKDKPNKSFDVLNNLEKKILGKELPDESGERHYQGELPDESGERHYQGELPDESGERHYQGELPDESGERHYQGELPDESGERHYQGELPDESGERHYWEELPDESEEKHHQEDVQDIQGKNNKSIERNEEKDIPSEIKGGSYRDVKKYSDGELEDVHHIPAKSISTLEKDDGPAIRMEKGDHRQTASYGNSREAREYRNKQEELVKQGKFREAVQMDIDDIREKFGDKYDEAIAQMEKYIDKLEKEGKING